MKKINIIGMLLLLTVAACTATVVENTTEEDDSLEEDDLFDFVIINEEIQTTDDGTKYLVNPDKLRRGISRPGDIKDAIPSIDNPSFTTVEKADEWIQDNELVLALEYDGVKRVYPLQILVWHEIINEEINGKPLLITYCPLCGSGIAYKREINGKAVEFGTSGKLFNSNLVMYDRSTETYWTQIEGRAIVGELTGVELEEISIDTVSWEEWKVEHPDSEVLKRPLGTNRPYGNDPYGNYYVDSQLFFPVENTDNRIHAKTIIFGIEVDGEFKAYKEEDVKQGSINDVVNNVNVLVERDKAGRVKITDQDSGKEIVKEREMWFAWYAFHPTTELYEP